MSQAGRETETDGGEGQRAYSEDQSQEESLEATGDSLVLAGGLHRIADGLELIAGAIEKLALAHMGTSDPEEEEQQTYLDGGKF